MVEHGTQRKGMKNTGFNRSGEKFGVRRQDAALGRADMSARPKARTCPHTPKSARGLWGRRGARGVRRSSFPPIGEVLGRIQASLRDAAWDQGRNFCGDSSPDGGVLAPLPGCDSPSAETRGCRYARPPATVWQPFRRRLSYGGQAGLAELSGRLQAVAPRRLELGGTHSMGLKPMATIMGVLRDRAVKY